MEEALLAGERVLSRHRYRIARYGDSVSAERGYLRETGNLVFHSAPGRRALAVFVGGGFTYTGQRILADGQTFVNVQHLYDSHQPRPLLRRRLAAALLAALDRST